MRSPGLYVPVEVDALVINRDNRRPVNWSRWQMAYLNLPSFTGLTPGINENRQRSQLPAEGVYLQWQLPKFLLSGRSEGQGTENATVGYPTLPNRWLVVRKENNKEDAEKDRCVAWVVESDYLADTSGHDRATPFPDVQQGRKQVYLGRKVDLNRWSAHERGVRRIPKLDVSCTGDLSFTEFQPYNLNVFSIHDPYTPPVKTYFVSYFVAGWYHDSNIDPLYPVQSDADFRAFLNKRQLDVLLPQTLQTPAIPKVMVFHGMICGVGEGDLSLNVPDEKEAGLLCGTTSAETVKHFAPELGATVKRKALQTQQHDRIDAVINEKHDKRQVERLREYHKKLLDISWEVEDLSRWVQFKVWSEGITLKVNEVSLKMDKSSLELGLSEPDESITFVRAKYSWTQGFSETNGLKLQLTAEQKKYLFRLPFVRNRVMQLSVDSQWKQTVFFVENLAELRFCQQDLNRLSRELDYYLGQLYALWWKCMALRTHKIDPSEYPIHVFAAPEGFREPQHAREIHLSLRDNALIVQVHLPRQRHEFLLLARNTHNRQHLQAMRGRILAHQTGGAIELSEDERHFVLKEVGVFVLFNKVKRFKALMYDAQQSRSRHFIRHLVQQYQSEGTEVFPFILSNRVALANRHGRGVARDLGAITIVDGSRAEMLDTFRAAILAEAGIAQDVVGNFLSEIQTTTVDPLIQKIIALHQQLNTNRDKRDALLQTKGETAVKKSTAPAFFHPSDPSVLATGLKSPFLGKTSEDRLVCRLGNQIYPFGRDPQRDDDDMSGVKVHLRRNHVQGLELLLHEFDYYSSRDGLDTRTLYAYRGKFIRDYQQRVADLLRRPIAVSTDGGQNAISLQYIENTIRITFGVLLGDDVQALTLSDPAFIARIRNMTPDSIQEDVLLRRAIAEYLASFLIDYDDYYGHTKMYYAQLALPFGWIPVLAGISSDSARDRVSTYYRRKDDNVISSVTLEPVIDFKPWRQPWHPLFFEWEVECQYGRQCFKFDMNSGEYIYDPTVQPAGPPTVLSSRTVLTQETVGQVRRLLSGEDPANAGGLFTKHEDFLAMLKQWDVLSLQLNHLFNQLKGEEPGAALKMQRQDFLQLSRGLPADLIALLQSRLQYQSNPPLLSQDVSREWLVPQGSIHFRQARVIDRFGQVLTLIRHDTREQRLLSTPLLEARNLPVNTLLLYPKFAQDLRVNFDWVDTHKKPDKTVSVDDSANPIYGWVMVNYLENSLVFYAADGSPLGEVFSDDGNIVYQQTPLSRYETVDSLRSDYPKMFNFVCWLMQPDCLPMFMLILNSAFSTTIHPSTDAERFTSWLVGRPLALTRARLQLELAEPPYLEQSWWQTLSRPSWFDRITENHDISLPATCFDRESRQFPVKLGNQGLNRDGLVGYWFEQEHLTQFYTQYTDDASAQISPVTVDNTVRLTPTFNPVQAFVYLTCLIDPYMKMHIYSGILPMHVVQLPRSLYEASLKEIAITFSTGPVLIPDPPWQIHERIDDIDDEPADGGKLEMPLQVRDKLFSWVTALDTRLTGGEDKWRQFTIKPAPMSGAEDARMPTVCDGWFSLMHRRSQHPNLTIPADLTGAPQPPS